MHGSSSPLLPLINWSLTSKEVGGEWKKTDRSSFAHFLPPSSPHYLCYTSDPADWLSILGRHPTALSIANEKEFLPIACMYHLPLFPPSLAFTSLLPFLHSPLIQTRFPYGLITSQFWGLRGGGEKRATPLWCPSIITFTLLLVWQKKIEAKSIFIAVRILH